MPTPTLPTELLIKIFSIVSSPLGSLSLATSLKAIRRYHQTLPLLPRHNRDTRTEGEIEECEG